MSVALFAGLAACGSKQIKKTSLCAAPRTAEEIARDRKDSVTRIAQSKGLPIGFVERNYESLRKQDPQFNEYADMIDEASASSDCK